MPNLLSACKAAIPMDYPTIESCIGNTPLVRLQRIGQGNGNTILLKLESTAGTGFFYVKKRNPRKYPEKLSFKKYDPVARKHVLFKEVKLSS